MTLNVPFCRLRAPSAALPIPLSPLHQLLTFSQSALAPSLREESRRWQVAGRKLKVGTARRRYGKGRIKSEIRMTETTTPGTALHTYTSPVGLNIEGRACGKRDVCHWWPFDFAQGRECFDSVQHRELVERPVERLVHQWVVSMEPQTCPP